MLIGVAMLLISALLVAAALALGRGVLGKYLVAIGLLAGLTGASFILHGVWDWIK